MPTDSPEDDEYNYKDGYWRCGRADRCGHTAGWGTDHVGVGACRLHGGSSLRGEDHPDFKHGLFSDVVREEDHDLLQKIEQMSTAAKLESTLNMQVMKLHRAIEAMESEDRTAFIEVFEDVVGAAAAPDQSISTTDLRYLAEMLTSNERSVREWMDLIRKTAKDLHKITDGETVTVEHGSSEELEELLDTAEDLF